MLDALGDRPLGMEAAQLIRIASWADQKAGVSKVRVEASGMRSQIGGVSGSSADARPIDARNRLHSFGYVFDKPVDLDNAPEIFCFDFYNNFDIDRLEAVAAPVLVHHSDYLDLGAK